MTPKTDPYLGETEWTKSGRYTGSTDIPLTSTGESQVLVTAHKVVGPNQIIDPSNLLKVFISPRTRAQKTFQILFSAQGRKELEAPGRVKIESRIREWEYGLYEGKLTAEIREMRASRGLDKDQKWDIWRDGCEEGESADELAERLDDIIREIQEMQAEFLNGKGGQGRRDVLVVAHGHSLRAFAKRWIKFPMHMRLPLMLEPGAVGVLSYEHKNVAEPALLLGINLGGAGGH